jgi:glycosyltransferase involved in cell wall biosynthesis
VGHALSATGARDEVAPATPPRQLRILWIIKGLGQGGAEQLLVNLARARDRAGFDYQAAYLVPWKNALVRDLEAAAVPVECLAGARELDPRWAIRLRRRLRSSPVDVVHVHSPYVAAVVRIVGRTLPRRSRPVVMSTEHNVWERYSRLTYWANRLTYRLDAAHVAVSDGVRATIPTSLQAITEVVVHGVDLDAVRAQRVHREAVRAELGFADDEVVFGTVANYRVQKAYPDMLQAARTAIDSGAEVRFVAVGQGPLEAEIAARHAELGLGDGFQLLGYRDDAQRILSGCDVFTLSSIHEGLPVALMEALAIGLPVVATTVGGIPEAVTEGVEALLVAPSRPDLLAKAYIEIAGDAPMRVRMAAAAAERSRDFGVEPATRRIEEIYRSIVDARSATTTNPSAGRAPTAAAAPTPPPVAPTGDRPPKKRPELRIERGRPEHEAEILSLLASSLGATDDESYRRFFRWKHLENPFGASPVWIAFDGDRMAGFRTMLRWEFVRNGAIVHAVRAVDTATHLDYRGIGVFTVLTRRALEDLAEEGTAFVFNTPNDQSRPGYLKMGWEVVAQVPAALRPLSLTAPLRIVQARVPADRWSTPTEAGLAASTVLGDPALARLIDGTGRITDRRLRTHLSLPYLSWRYGSDVLSYRAVIAPEGAGAGVAFFRLRRRGPALEAVLGDVIAGGDAGVATALVRSVARQARSAGAHYLLRIGSGEPGWRGRYDRGFITVPGQGPILTWRAILDTRMPPLPDWALTMGDIELF